MPTSSHHYCHYPMPFTIFYFNYCDNLTNLSKISFVITLSSLSPQPLHNHQIHYSYYWQMDFLRMNSNHAKPYVGFLLGRNKQSSKINMVYKDVSYLSFAYFASFIQVILNHLTSYVFIHIGRCFQNVPWCYCDQCPGLSGTSPVLPLKISHLGETLLSTRQITVKLLLNGMEPKK